MTSKYSHGYYRKMRLTDTHFNIQIKEPDKLPGPSLRVDWELTRIIHPVCTRLKSRASKHLRGRGYFKLHIMLNIIYPT